MTKYNLRHNQADPSDEQIKRHQDFGELLKQHKQETKKVVPLFRRTWVRWSSIAAFLLLFAGVGWLWTQSQMGDAALSSRSVPVGEATSDVASSNTTSAEKSVSKQASAAKSSAAKRSGKKKLFKAEARNGNASAPINKSTHRNNAQVSPPPPRDYDSDGAIAPNKSPGAATLAEAKGVQQAIDQNNLAWGKNAIAPGELMLEEADEMELEMAKELKAAPIPGRDKYFADTINLSLGADHNPTHYDPFIENEFIPTTENNTSTFSIDVDKAAYSNVRRQIQSGTLPDPAAVRIEEMINYFNYDYAAPNGKHPIAIHSELTNCPWNSNSQLAMIALQAEDFPVSQMPSNNLVFLLDVSGSMNNFDKLPLLTESLKMMIDNLRPDDRIAIVVYAGAAGLVLPSTPVSQGNIIKSALDNLSAGGSTAGGEGIHLAYRVAKENFVSGGNNRVILCTDGDFNVGASSDASLVKLIEKKRKTGVYLSVLGFGTGNYQDQKMEKLSNHGNGNYAYISNRKEAEKILVREMAGTLYTVAEDVKLQIEFNPKTVHAYRLIGYENRRLKNEDFDDDTKDAGEIGAKQQVTAFYEIIPSSAETASANMVEVYKPKDTGFAAGESVKVRLRYKKPGQRKSIKIEDVLSSKGTAIEDASENMRFAVAVATYAQILRKSKYAGVSTLQQVYGLAANAISVDPDGEKKEFIQLVQETIRLK